MDKVKEKVIVSIWNISCMEVVINLQFKVRGKENTIPDARLVHAHWIFSGKKQKVIIPVWHDDQNVYMHSRVKCYINMSQTPQHLHKTVTKFIAVTTLLASWAP